MHRIEIDDFGPVRELKLDVKDFMLFLGPQASGKSTVAKTIFFFKSLKDFLIDYFDDAITHHDFSKSVGTHFEKIIRRRFLDLFGEHSSSTFRLSYFYNDAIWIKIESDSNKNIIASTFSKKLLIEINSLIQQTKEFSKTLIKDEKDKAALLHIVFFMEEKAKYINYLKQAFNSLFEEDRQLIFVPAGRSFLSLMSNQTQFIENNSIDYLMKSFVEKINAIKPSFNKSLREIAHEHKLLTNIEIDDKTVTLAEKIIQNILKGNYQNDKDGEKIYINENQFVKLNFASSGQQEALWILLLIFILILDQLNVFIVIEEPEAHLFPEAQKEIVALIALLSNMKQSQVIITTHSPYILASVNNLILANKVGQKYADTVSKKINKNIWLNRDKIYAAFVQSGTVEEIMDSEFDIIQQEQIDSISRIINDEFDFLYSYEAEDNICEDSFNPCKYTFV
jgi:predicted ATPase